jgi:hypothetical protein
VPEAGFQWVEAIPWVLGGASLLWNLINSIYTSRVQGSVRRKTVRLEEFRSKIRAPIEAGINAVREARKALASLEASASPIEDIRKELIEINRAIIAALGEVEDALLKADASQFAEGSDWSALLSDGRDQCLQAMDTAMSPTRSQAETMQAIKRADGQLKSVCEGIDSRLESEVQQYL